MTAREAMVEFPEALCTAGGDMNLYIQSRVLFEARMLILHRDCMNALVVVDCLARYMTFFTSSYRDVSPDERPPMPGHLFSEEAWRVTDKQPFFWTPEKAFEFTLRLRNISGSDVMVRACLVGQELT